MLDVLDVCRKLLDVFPLPKKSWPKPHGQMKLNFDATKMMFGAKAIARENNPKLKGLEKCEFQSGNWNQVVDL